MILFGLCKLPPPMFPQRFEDWIEYEKTIKLKVGPYILNPLMIKYSILRNNMQIPSLISSKGYVGLNIEEKKINIKHKKENSLMIFGLSYPYKSSPGLKLYSEDIVTSQLKDNAEQFLGIGKLVKNKDQIQLPGILEIYKEDYKDDDEYIEFIKTYLPEEYIVKHEEFFVSLYYCI